MKDLKTRHVGRGGAVVAFTALMVVALAAPALAATTSAASANALRLVLANNSIVTTGTCATATGQPVTGTCGPVISLLSGQTSLDIGAIAQNVAANSDGSSAACAGAVGAGGVVQVGGPPTCSVTAGSAGINLGDALLVDAVLAQCNTDSSGHVTAQVTIVGLTLGGTSILPGPPGTPFNPGVNDAIIPGVLTLNKQTTNSDGSLTVTALDLALTPDPLNPDSGVHLSIGTVTCGPLSAPATNAFPTKGLPIAGGVAVLGLGGAYLRRRHNLAAARA